MQTIRADEQFRVFSPIPRDSADKTLAGFCARSAVPWIPRRFETRNLAEDANDRGPPHVNSRGR